MRAGAGHIFAWAICIVIGLLVGEIAGAIIFYKQQGQIVYSNKRARAPAKQAQQTTPVGQRLHPYLGFGGYYSMNTQTMVSNNLGFSQRIDYEVPFTTKANDVAVFVFGGSVAGNLVAPPQQGLSLERALRQKMPGKNVIVYSMAQGSGKQPQQLIALAMLLAMGQHIDVVVNLDGYNDLAFGYTNHFYRVHPIFPSAAIMWAIGNTLETEHRSGDFYRTAADLIESRLAITNYNNSAPTSRFGLSYLYRKVGISLALRQKARAEARYVGAIHGQDNVERTKYLMGIDLPVDEKADATAMAFDIWLKSDEAMAALSRSVGAKYVHVIQPNQYFSKRKFSAEEARIALSMPSTDVMRIGAERGYAMLEKNADLIAKHGIVSGISILDEAPGIMYFDNCCHYSTAGETILANFVADQVVRRLAEANETLDKRR